MSSSSTSWSLSVSAEHELAADTSVRVAYVDKRLQNHFGVWNRAQQLPLRASPVPCGDAIFRAR